MKFIRYMIILLLFFGFPDGIMYSMWVNRSEQIYDIFNNNNEVPIPTYPPIRNFDVINKDLLKWEFM